MKRTLITSLTLCAGFALAEGASTALESLNAVNDQFNHQAAEHDAAGLLGLYAQDTLWIAPGLPVSQGISGPRELFEFVTKNEGTVTHTIDHLFVANDASLAVMIGSVEAKIETFDQDATGTYLFVLTPKDDGWEIVTDMWHEHIKN